MKNIIIFFTIFLSQISSFGQANPISLKFEVDGETISLDTTLNIFFVINNDSIYPNINENTFYIPSEVADNYADFNFIYKNYKLVYYSVMINETQDTNRIWKVNIDKRPIDKSDYYFVQKKEFRKIKWIYTLIRGNSQITEYVYRFPWKKNSEHR